jgi:hypothetical protein
MQHTMKMGKLVTLALVLAGIALADKTQNETVTITSLPPGATVEIDRRIVGTTPLTLKYGDYAFNPVKTTLFSKRLSSPLLVRVYMEGFIGKEQLITKEYQWWSMDRTTSYLFYIIQTNFVHFELDKIAVRPKLMSNNDVIDLVKLGFSDDLIIDRINDSPAGFSLEMNDLVKLREANVSESILRAMFKAR